MKTGGSNNSKSWTLVVQATLSFRAHRRWQPFNSVTRHGLGCRQDKPPDEVRELHLMVSLIQLALNVDRYYLPAWVINSSFYSSL